MPAVAGESRRISTASKPVRETPVSAAIAVSLGPGTFTVFVPTAAPPWRITSCTTAGGDDAVLLSWRASWIEARENMRPATRLFEPTPSTRPSLGSICHAWPTLQTPVRDLYAPTTAGELAAEYPLGYTRALMARIGTPDGLGVAQPPPLVTLCFVTVDPSPGTYWR